MSRQLYLMIILATILSSCKEQQRYSILEFTGEGEVMNFSKSLYPVYFELDSVKPTAMLASKGDLIFYGDQNCFYYKDSLKKSFSVKVGNGNGFIDGKINSITIPGQTLLTYLGQMEEEELSSLGFIFIDSLDENYLQLMPRIAEINPRIGLGYDGALRDLTRILSIFNPELLVGIELFQEDFNILQNLKMEILLLNQGDTIFTLPLPEMRELDQLILSDFDIQSIKTNDFFSNNPQLRKLVVRGYGKFDLSLIEPLVNLRELSLFGMDSIENFSLAEKFSKLELLSVYAGHPVSGKLPRVKWLSIYENLTQADFDEIIGSQQSLEVVEIIRNSTINNLRPLGELRKLYGLIITDTLTDLASVKTMKNLKYLSVPSETISDSAILAGLRQSLPGTVIAANSGICLGSGWLLLIIPMILLFRFLSLYLKGHTR